MNHTTIAIIQHPPAVLDLCGSMERARTHIADAAHEGAELVVFPETWLTCYPAWVFGLAEWDSSVGRHWHARLLQESPRVGNADDMDDDLQSLRDAATENNVSIVMGLNERSWTGGTLYNSQVVIGPDGRVLNLHRKMMPTHTERIVWGLGDAAGARAVDTPSGRVGALVCWEHWMPLARQTMHASGEEIHVSSWPDFTDMHQIAARGYAFEGRCFVLCAASYVTYADIPPELRDAYRLGAGADMPDGQLFNGGSAVIAPNGEWIIEPTYDRRETIIANLDLPAIDAHHQTLDVVGHYARNDLFELRVDRTRQMGGVTEVSE